jgi:hypothetical protein
MRTHECNATHAFSATCIRLRRSWRITPKITSCVAARTKLEFTGLVSFRYQKQNVHDSASAMQVLLHHCKCLDDVRYQFSVLITGADGVGT